MNDLVAQSIPVLSVENLKISFRVSGKKITAIDGCSFHVNSGKILGIVGESGCGKSVTSLSIMRLLSSNSQIDSGIINFQNNNLLDLSEEKMRKIRGNQISMIFQEPMTSLNPVYTIGDQIAEVFILHKKMSKKEAWSEALEMLKKVKISSPEKRINDYPHQLSGGMRQRVMIAMALACKPQLLIADEPTTALDVTIQAQILALITGLQKENNMSTILITHDLGVVAETCDDVIVMYAGKIVEKGSVKDIFLNPKHPYTQGLLNSIPKLGSKLKRLNTIPGMVPSLSNLPVGCRFHDRCSLASSECKDSEPNLKLINSGHCAACIKI